GTAAESRGCRAWGRHRAVGSLRLRRNLPTASSRAQRLPGLIGPHRASHSRTRLTGLRVPPPMDASSTAPDDGSGGLVRSPPRYVVAISQTKKAMLDRPTKQAVQVNVLSRVGTRVSGEGLAWNDPVAMAWGIRTPRRRCRPHCHC